MPWRKSPPHLITLFNSVIPADARVERRQMFGYPAAFAGGKLFAGLHQENFILKLPEADRHRLQSEHGAQPFEPMPGRRMREYIVLPEVVLSDRAALDTWLSRSLAYAASQTSTKGNTRTATPRSKQRATRRSSRGA